MFDKCRGVSLHSVITENVYVYIYIYIYRVIIIISVK